MTDTIPQLKEQDMATGRVPSGQALVSDEASTSLHPSGFDPSRIAELARACRFEISPNGSLERGIDLALYGSGMATEYRYTNSIDDAARLVPQGHAWGVGFGAEGQELGDERVCWAWCGVDEGPFNWAATPALALCAAALDAQAIATEARRAATTGAVEDEGAGPQDIAQ